MDFLLLIRTLAVGLIVLGILVLIHELGHFIAAKLLGIRVLAFSIGFGRPILKKTVGETEYRISVIPFGGYVHMAGEHPEDEHEADPDEFAERPIRHRATVAVAGPFFNLVFAALFLWIAFMIGVSREAYLERPVIGGVVDSLAGARAGLAAGDSIVSIAGEPIESWDDVIQTVNQSGTSFPVTYVRNSVTQRTIIDVGTLSGGLEDRYGLMPPLPAVVGSVPSGKAGAEAGFKAGDRILSVNGEPIDSWYEFSFIVADYDTASSPLNVEVERGDRIVTLTASPEYDAGYNRPMIGIGVESPPTKTVQYGPVSAVPMTLAKSWDYTTMIFDVISKLISRNVSPRQLAGPIGIVQMSGTVALGGFAAILDFMALIGINLAVLNLMPLIITDGGQLMFLALEGIRGKPLSLKAQLLINKVAIILFIMLFLYVTFNDIQRAPQLFRLFSK